MKRESLKEKVESRKPDGGRQWRVGGEWTVAVVVLLLWLRGIGVGGAAEFRGLPGEFSAVAISGDGSTIAGSVAAETDAGRRVPARYFVFFDTLQDLGTVTSEFQAGSSMVGAVSRDGRVISGSLLEGAGPAGAFLWEQEGPLGAPRLIRLAAPEVGSVTSPGLVQFTTMEALALSADGTVAAGQGQDAETEQPHAIVWRRAANGAYEPALLPKEFGGNGLAIGVARGIATAGGSERIVGNQTGFLGNQAVIFGAARLTNGPNFGTTLASPYINVANAVSANGTTVVGCEGGKAFRSAGLVNVSLGNFTPDEPSTATDVSADGTRVVGWGTAGGEEVAFLWDPSTGMRSIRDILLAAGGADLEGWDLQRAVAISDDGERIAGTGTFEGVARSWLAIIPKTPLITSPLALFVVSDGNPFFYQTLATENATQYAAENLPDGLALDSATGVIQGTKPALGQYVITLTATNANGSTSVPLTVNVGLRPQITSAGAAAGAVELPFAYQITATNGATTYGASGLPAGLTVNPVNGMIAGTPRVSGVFFVTLRAANAFGEGTAILRIDAGAPVLGFTSETEAFGTVGAPFTFQIAASNAPASFGALGLPPGLSVDASGLISGTPTVAGTTIVMCTATNAAGTGNYFLTIKIGMSIAGFDPNAPEQTLGHGLEAEILSVEASLSTYTVVAAIKIRNPSTLTSFAGFLEVRDKTGALASYSFVALEPGFERILNVDVAVDSTGDQNLVMAALFERNGDLDILQREFALAEFFKVTSFPDRPVTGEATGGVTQPTAGPVVGEPPMGFTRLEIYGPSQLEENQTGEYLAVGFLADGSTFTPGNVSWQATRYSIGPDGRLATGIAQGNAQVSLTAAVVAQGAVKTATKQVTVVDLSPVVSVTRSTPFVGESGSEQAVFRFRRTAPLAGELSLSLAAGGTSTAGEDHVALPATVTFAPGEALVELPLVVLSDSIFEADETVSISIQENDALYTRGTPATATVTIQDSGRFRGVYNGLVVRADGADSPRGLARFALNAQGKVTGTVTLEGVKHRFRASLNEQATALGIKLGRSEWQMNLQLDFTGESEQLTGELIRSGELAGTVVADRALYTTAPAPVAPFRNLPVEILDPKNDRGRYTALLSAANPPASGVFPFGSGWARATVSPAGTVTLRGRLSDGTPFQYANGLSRSNELPIYLPLYGKKGVLNGVVQFDPNLSATDVSGVLEWARPAMPRNLFFPEGWPAGMAVDLQGSKFVAARPATATNPSPLYVAGVHNALGLESSSGPTEGLLEFSQGVLALGNEAAVDARSRVVVGGAAAGATAAVSAKAVLAGKNGGFKGSFLPPGAKALVPFTGVVVQKSRRAGGFYLWAPGGGSGEVGLRGK